MIGPDLNEQEIADARRLFAAGGGIALACIALWLVIGWLCHAIAGPLPV